MEKNGFGFNNEMQELFVMLYSKLGMEFSELTPYSLTKSNYIYARMREASKYAVTPDDYTSYIFGNFPEIKTAYLGVYLDGAKKTPDIPVGMGNKFRTLWFNSIALGFDPKKVAEVQYNLIKWPIDDNGSGLTRAIVSKVYTDTKKTFPTMTPLEFSQTFDVIYGFSGAMCEKIEEVVKLHG